MFRRRLACALLAAGVLAGCSPGEPTGSIEGDTLTVYVSVPLRGPSGEHGRAIRDGARLALEDADGKAGEVEVEAAYLDDTAGGRWSPGVVGQNARRAVSDTTAIAYIGEFESGATRVSLPITNEARMLQVSPASTALDLVSPFPGSDEVPDSVQPSGERTFGRVIPDDEAQAGAGAVWAKRLSVGRAVAFSLERFGDVVAEQFSGESEELGISVQRTTRITRLQGALGSRPELVYLAVPSPYGLGLFEDTARQAPSAILMGTDAQLLDSTFLGRAVPFESQLRLTASAQDPAQLPPEGQQFVRAYRRAYGREPDPYAVYGYEAMAVVLDSISRAGDQAEDRTAVVDEFYDTVDRDSVLGTYSIDEVGDTTLDRLAGYRVRGGLPVFAAALRAR